MVVLKKSIEDNKRHHGTSRKSSSEKDIPVNIAKFHVHSRTKDKYHQGTAAQSKALTSNTMTFGSTLV